MLSIAAIYEGGTDPPMVVQETAFYRHKTRRANLLEHSLSAENVVVTCDLLPLLHRYDGVYS